MIFRHFKGFIYLLPRVGVFGSAVTVGDSAVTVGDSARTRTRRCTTWYHRGPYHHYPGYPPTHHCMSGCMLAVLQHTVSGQWLVRQAPLVIDTSGLSFCRFSEPLKFMKISVFPVFSVF